MESTPLLRRRSENNHRNNLIWALILGFGYWYFVHPSVIQLFATNPFAKGPEKLPGEYYVFTDEINNFSAPRKVSIDSTGPIPIEIFLSTTSSARFKYQIMTDENEMPLIIDYKINQDLSVTVTSKEKKNTRVKLFVELPLQRYETLMNIQVGEIHWSGQSLHSDLRLRLDSGFIQMDALEANKITIAIDNGSVFLRSVEIKSNEKSEIKTTNGDIMANVYHSRQLDLQTNQGNVVVTMEPLQDSNSFVSVESGSISLTVRNYQGRLESIADVGYVTVQGQSLVIEKEMTDRGMIVRGSVGDQKSELKTRIQKGFIRTLFLQE